MQVQNFNLKPIAGALLFGFALPAFALHLGEPRAISYVGEQLKVDVPILDSTIEETKDMVVKSVAYPYGRKFEGHTDYSISIRYENNTPVITINSPAPVNESIVDVAIEISWAAGRMIQPLTLVLDDKPSRQKTVLPAETTITEIKPVTEHIIESKAYVGKIETKAISKEPPIVTTGEYKVKTGETLNSIASKTKPDNLTIADWSKAIYKANPKAFVKSPNLLLANSNLVLPSDVHTYKPNDVHPVSVKPAQVSHIKHKTTKVSSDVSTHIKVKVSKEDLAKEAEIKKTEARVKELELQVKELMDEVKSVDSKIEKLQVPSKSGTKPITPVAPLKKSSMPLFEDKSKGLLVTLDAYRKLRSVG